MIRKPSEQKTINRAPGVDIQVLVEPHEMYDAGRLYARITIAPGASLAYHRHESEMESFYVLKGTCRVDDNEESAILSVGDVMVTPAGQCHAIYNDSSEPVELMALIISCKQGVAGKSVTI